jgi:hypothetical protein
MGLGDFMKDVGHAAVNVGKGVEYIADPRHADNIASATVKTGEFVYHHPSVVKDVGVAIAKDQLKPKNLAINAALIAATMAGGAAAPALAARFGMAAKAGITAAEGIEAATEVGRAAKIGEEAVQAGKVAKEVVEGGQEAGRIARGMEKINEFRSATSPITQRTASFRTGLGEKILAGGGEGEASMGRQMLANAVQGTGGIGAPTRMAGQSDQAYKMQQATRYIRMGQGAQDTARNTPGNVTTAVKTAANPEKAAMHAATQAGKARYGEQFGEPTGEEYKTYSGGQAVLPGQEDAAMQSSSVSPNGVPMPPGRDQGSISNPFAGRKLSFESGRQARPGKNGRTDIDTVRKALQPSQHFWQGPNREAFGGIGTDYDWRTFKQRGTNAKAINLPKLRMAKRAGEADGEGEGEGVSDTGPSGVTTATNGRLLTTPELGVSNAGVRMISNKPRGSQDDRNTHFSEGYTYGEEGGNTVVGGKQNANVQGSFVFADLQQPTASAQPGATAQVGGVTSPMYNKPKPKMKSLEQPEQMTLGV